MFLAMKVHPLVTKNKVSINQDGLNHLFSTVNISHGFYTRLFLSLKIHEITCKEELEQKCRQFQRIRKLFFHTDPKQTNAYLHFCKDTHTPSNIISVFQTVSPFTKHVPDVIKPGEEEKNQSTALVGS